MIGFVPEPVAGELLYSLIARWRAKFGCSASAAMRTWFGNPDIGLTFATPKVGIVAARLPPSCGLDALTLMERHTLLPYFSSFITRNVFARALDSMLSGLTHRVGTLCAPTPVGGSRMVFCPECATDDVRSAGFPTWRREHHAPGVIVCPEHGCSLRIGARQGSRVAPTLATPPADLRGAEIEDPFPGDVSIRMARLSQALIGRVRPPFEQEVMTWRVRRLLAGRGYLLRGGRVCIERLQRDMVLFFGEPGLASVNRAPGASGSCKWLAHLASYAGHHIVSPTPLILLMAMTDCDWPEFEAPSPQVAGLPVRQGRPSVSQRTVDAKLPSYKREIAAYVRANPTVCRNGVRSALPSACRFVSGADRMWYDAVLPPRIGSLSRPRPVDTARDSRAQAALGSAIARELSKAASPRRMGLGWLYLAAGIRKHERLDARSELPGTVALIMASEESYPEFRRRRMALEAGAVSLAGVSETLVALNPLQRSTL